MKAIERSRWRCAARAPALALAALAGACAAPQAALPPAPPPAPPAPVRAAPPPPPPPASAPDWRDAPITPGNWRWGMVDGHSTASFGPAGAAPLAVLSCERFLGEVRLARAGTAEGHVPMAVTTTTGTRPLLSEPVIGPPGWITAQVKARDPILDAMAFSRGRFALDVAGFAPLYLPSWPEVSRVIEDCRAG